jgi:hypothetical protein
MTETWTIGPLGAWNQLGALLTAALGLMGLVAPRVASRFVSLEPAGRIGISELRATYGGLFLGLGGFALASQAPAAFAAAGVAWLCAGAGRLLSVLIDRSRDAKNVAGIAFELGIGALLLL